MKTPFTPSRIFLALLLCIPFASHASAQSPAPVPEVAPIPDVPPIPEVPIVPDVAPFPEIAPVPPPIPPEPMIAMDFEPPTPPELSFVMPPLPPTPPESPVPVAPPEFTAPVEPMLAVPFAVPQAAAPTVPPVPTVPPQPPVPTPPSVPSPPRVSTQTPAAPQTPATPAVPAQTFPSLESIQNQADLDKVIMSLSLALFDAYNRCDLDAFRSFLAQDIEFYHDQGGITLGAAALTESIKKNICGGDVRRELVPGTFQANYMKGYGAVELGSHRFLHPKSHNPTGEGKYISLWQYKDGKWLITREISYDHHQAQTDATKAAPAK
jgi:hypothetical protein